MFAAYSGDVWSNSTTGERATAGPPPSITSVTSSLLLRLCRRARRPVVVVAQQDSRVPHRDEVPVFVAEAGHMLEHRAGRVRHERVVGPDDDAVDAEHVEDEPQ